MNKKSIIILICGVIILIAGLVYYFKFTFSGEETLYNIFGGNNLHLVNNETEIYWFDARHSNSSSDPMFAKIEKSFTEFSPDLVLVEGGFNTFEGVVLNPIYNDIYSYRNTYLVELIKEKKSIYDKIFIVMGGSHLADTKEELVKLYSN